MSMRARRLLADAQSLHTFIADIRSVLDQMLAVALAQLQVALTTPDNAIQQAYHAWTERSLQYEATPADQSKIFAMQQQRAFAEQVSYVCFTRLLLAHLLADKKLLPPALAIADYQHWLAPFNSPAQTPSPPIIPQLYHSILSFEKHFFQQSVFNWFQPDDALLTLVLQHLHQYDFHDVSNDLLGFTYEAFIERVARNQKGYFLTSPALVDFMLDRAGYTSHTIIGSHFLDPSCGSGSFLVHAARRLRHALQSTLANSTPLARARIFIAQTRTRLVGLEINPFSCYLAELNLFVQTLDDLALLWQANEDTDTSHFAIYHTNSLELPASILEHGYMTESSPNSPEQLHTSDAAATLKTQPQTFTYILCNPPYVNRGVVRGAKSYAEYPFYREVVKGDENFYLLFLRLAAYYVAPGGHICFICPLNLLGDESTRRTREKFQQDQIWNLRSITRFYARTVLFPGVLQGICVICIDHQPAHKDATIEVRGGFSVQAAQQQSTPLPRAKVLASYPASNSWSRPWLVHTDPAVYTLWDFIRTHTQHNLSELIAGKLHTAKGDVRSTWTKALRTSHPTPGTLPLTKGAHINDWGDWSATTYIDPTRILPPTIEYYKNTLWVQKNVQRIANLPHSETVLLLKEISGLEMQRPIRGTFTRRSAAHPVVADETVLVLYTHDPVHTTLACAVFGLLTSSLYNFLFNLFSTNAHANFKEILRLPIPPWSTRLEQSLSTLTQQTFQAFQELYQHEKLFGKNPHHQIDLNTLVTTSTLPTIPLNTLIAHGDLTLHGPPSYTIASLLKRGQLTFAPSIDPAVRLAITHLLQANADLSLNYGGENLLIPAPNSAPAFLALLEQTRRQRSNKIAQTIQQQQQLDEQVMHAYALNAASRLLVTNGLPWAKQGPARSANHGKIYL